MSNTLPNVIVEPETVTDLYAETGITVGTKIEVIMIGTGIAKLYAGATLTTEPTDATGYIPLVSGQIATNESGDAGAFIWSRQGCTVNVREA